MSNAKESKEITLLDSSLTLKIEKKELLAENALIPILDKINLSKGAIFSSGLDYPGKHSRWDIAFVSPALEFISKKDSFFFNALNEQGSFLVEIIESKLSSISEIKELSLNKDNSLYLLSGKIPKNTGYFSEEERSKQPSIFSVLRAVNSLFKHEEPLADMFGFYGAFGYDLVHQFEDLELKLERDENLKDAHLFLPLELVVIDRQKNQAFQNNFEVSNASGSTSDFKPGGAEFPLHAPSGDSEIKSDHPPGEFAEKVQKVIDGTKKGDYFEVVLSQCFETRFEQTPSELFKELAEINPSPYLFCINLGDEQLVGSSPEIYVRVTGSIYETCPIAGTVKRGKTALEDADKVKELISSYKDESELTMCTDVDRNDMARVCKPGSVKVIGRRQLEFYSHLIHTVDHVSGELEDGFDSLDAFQTHMWACTVTGAPKPAALQEIENLEKSPREWYSGAIGLLLFNGNINTGITLRTAQLKNGRAKTRSGATLLYGSEPKAEEQETLTKAGAFLTAISNIKSKNKKQKTPEKVKLTQKRKILLVDCRDSFVHNLATYLRHLGAEVITVRTGFPETLFKEINPDLLFLSPGPGTPDDFGIPELVKKASGMSLPIFGVCLGHQGIAKAFGANILELETPKHGKCSKVSYEDKELFNGLEQGFEVGRYHSLYVEEATLPSELSITAKTIKEDESPEPEIIMGLKHNSLPIASVQFHPESLMTLKENAGYKILANAINMLTKK